MLPRFSLEYGFFVVMGGIATNDVAKLMDNEDRRFTLNSSAIHRCALDGTFLEITPAIISDKSKANLLGKCLVCTQVVWFVIQCVARAAAKYPLTLIEIHTMVHVVCALSMYILWWKVSLDILWQENLHQLIVLVKKPQDISEPVIQDMSDCLDSLALMIVSRPLGRRTEVFDLLWYFDNGDLRRSKTTEAFIEDLLNSAKDELRVSKVSKWLDNYLRRNPEKRIDPVGPGGKSFWSVLGELDMEHFDFYRYMLVDHVSNFPAIKDLNMILYRRFLLAPTRHIRFHKLLYTILVVLSLVYGGLHLATWDFSFASKTEHLLWKIACIDIMATVPIGLLCIQGTALVIAPFRLQSHRRNPNRLTNLFLMALPSALFIFYASSTIYIVVESFISLRHVPIGVYAAVPWVQAIPHI